MPKTVLRSKGQLTLPNEIRTAAHLEEGDPIEVELTPDGILLRPQKVIDADQAWFWTAEWQKGEHQASAELEAGRAKSYDNTAKLLSELKARRKK